MVNYVINFELLSVVKNNSVITRVDCSRLCKISKYIPSSESILFKKIIEIMLVNLT